MLRNLAICAAEPQSLLRCCCTKSYIFRIGSKIDRADTTWRIAVAPFSKRFPGEALTRFGSRLVQLRRAENSYRGGFDTGRPIWLQKCPSNPTIVETRFNVLGFIPKRSAALSTALTLSLQLPRLNVLPRADYAAPVYDVRVARQRSRSGLLFASGSTSRPPIGACDGCRCAGSRSAESWR